MLLVLASHTVPGHHGCSVGPHLEPRGGSSVGGALPLPRGGSSVGGALPLPSLGSRKFVAARHFAAVGLLYHRGRSERMLLLAA
eukprot:3171991-Prorocentrum_lima.AAC.1